MGIQERKEREKGQRKEQILEAAEKVFFTRGLQNTTMDEIAKACELSKGTLYLYYKSKEELYSQIVLKALDMMYNAMAGNMAGKSTITEKLQAVGEAYFNFSKEYPSYFILLNNAHDTEHHLCHEPSPTQDEILQKSKKIWDIDVDLIKEGIKEGLFKKDINPYEISLILWSSSNGIIGIINHLNQYKHEPQMIEDSPISKVDCEETLYKLWEIIYLSLLKNPDDALLTFKKRKIKNKE